MSRKTYPHHCLGRHSSVVTNNFHKTSIKSQNKEAPIYASFYKASYTIEAAIIMPLFITLMVFGIFIFRVLQVQAGVQQSIDQASRLMAVTLGNVSNEGDSDEDKEINQDDMTLGSFLSEEALWAATVADAEYEIINRNVPVEFVDGGQLGFNFLDTSVEGNYVDVKVNYTMTFPVGLLGNFSFDVSQRARNRKWIGYDKAENESDSLYVYVTEKGEVYHTTMSCTYLSPSVHRVSLDEVDSKRNESGGKYSVCKKCKNVDSHGVVFITDYGTAYHNDANCNEIKHNIKKVLYEDVKDKMRACSKCGKSHE